MSELRTIIIASIALFRVFAPQARAAEAEKTRLGPWVATVTDGALELTSRGGAANFSGLEVWRGL